MRCALSPAPPFPPSTRCRFRCCTCTSRCCRSVELQEGLHRCGRCASALGFSRGLRLFCFTQVASERFPPRECLAALVDVYTATPSQAHTRHCETSTRAPLPQRSATCPYRCPVAWSVIQPVVAADAPLPPRFAPRADTTVCAARLRSNARRFLHPARRVATDGASALCLLGTASPVGWPG